MSDSSDDDVPLSALGKGKKEESSDEEAEFAGDLVDSEDEEEELDDNFVVEDEDEEEDEEEDYDDDSDESEDIPLSALKSKKEEKTPPKKSKKKKDKKKEKAKPAKKKTVAKKKTTTTKKKSTTTKKKAAVKSSASGSNWPCASNALYTHSEKGKLIQALLSRWWYAYEWPDPKDLLEETPTGYDALDGFPGMYVCTEGSNVGEFIDKRNHAKAPSFKNFARKSAEELKDMLLTAITNQRKKLQDSEGEGTDVEKELKNLEKWAMKLNCTKADKDAEKVLKAEKLKLP